MHRVLRIGAAVGVALTCAGRSYAQSPDVTAAITATPSRVAPGGLVTVTLTLTNSGAPTGRMFAGIALGGDRCINGGWYPPGMGSSAIPK
jgi:hypothetical protein